MIGRKLRIAIVALGASLSLFAAPSESKAFFDWLFHHNHCGTTACMPVAPAPCATCPAPVMTNYAPSCCPQVCNYVPQTCYRTVYVNMPVTTCQPVTTCDPCTGCPRTCMKQFTSYVPQARLIPYTSYRPVMTNACNYSPCGSGGCATGACGTGGCATGACGSPAVVAPTLNYAPAQPGCSSCGTPGYSSMPSYGGGMPGSAVSSLMPSAPAQPAMTTPVVPAPALSPIPNSPATPASNAQPTFQQNPNGGDSESSLRMQDPNYGNQRTNTTMPRRTFDSRDRMTARPVPQAWAYKSVSTPAVPRTTTSASAVNFDGWHSAR